MAKHSFARSEEGPEHKLSESQSSTNCLKTDKCLSMLKMQQKPKVGIKQKVFYVIYTSSTIHFVNVNSTNCSFNGIDDIMKVEENFEISCFTKGQTGDFVH